MSDKERLDKGIAGVWHLFHMALYSIPLDLETMSDKERLDKGIAGSLTVGAGLCILLCPIEYDLVIIGSFDF